MWAELQRDYAPPSMDRSSLTSTAENRWDASWKRFDKFLHIMLTVLTLGLNKHLEMTSLNIKEGWRLAHDCSAALRPCALVVVCCSCT